jgi:hypothetical protein
VWPVLVAAQSSARRSGIWAQVPRLEERLALSVARESEARWAAR